MEGLRKPESVKEMDRFWLCFVPLFVAVDVIGLLPMFLTMTAGFSKQQLRRVILQSTITAAAVSLSFLFIGKTILDLLGVSIADFMIAGGGLLFIISIKDMTQAQNQAASIDTECLGAVPIGVPLIVGPAVLTTIILLLNEYGVALTVSSIIINIAIAGIAFLLSGYINRILGMAGAKIVSKLANLLLAGIAVMLMRRGVVELIRQIGSHTT